VVAEEAAVILAVEGLARAFGGVHAIDGVTFGVREGTVHAVIGPNGAGKTTLINLLTGVYAPGRGRIRVDGRDLTGRAPHAFAAAGVSRTFQNLQVFFNMSAVENVMTGRHLRERSGLLPALLHPPSLAREARATRTLARELLDFVGLERHTGAHAEALPYGALKRLEIARALAAAPRVLLLDEPAAGLNATEALELDTLIRRIADAGTTVVLVEHNMRLVMNVSDRVLVLDAGRVLCEGTPAEVSADARVIEAYLGAAGAASSDDPRSMEFARHEATTGVAHA
jgi:branched-chain amino acid transport system ATP-binding protein